MKTQFLNFGLIFVNNEYSIINDATIFTDDDVIIIDFPTESERTDYLIENEIVYEDPNQIPGELTEPKKPTNL